MLVKTVSPARLMSQNDVFEDLKAMVLRLSRESSEAVVELTMECESLRHLPLATAPMNTVAK